VFSITASNAVLMLSIDSVYPSPIQLQEFGVDDAWTVTAVDATETQVGVDGFGVAGFVPQSPEMMIRFVASSPSVRVFEDWSAAMQQLNDVLYGHLLITMSAVGRKYTCYNGSLMRFSPMADGRRVLQNREFHIKWLPQGTIPAISAAPM
jgi:tail fiber protein gp32